MCWTEEGVECCGTNFQGERGCNELHGVTYRGVNLLEHAMKIVEKVLERRLWHIW